MRHEDIARVLQRLGIEPDNRFGPDDQDSEYTSCRTEEIGSYFRLYRDRDTDSKDRGVLCCFLLECLNELIQNESEHSDTKAILQELWGRFEENKDELAYWMDTSDPNEENWWPITRTLLDFAARR